MTLLYLIRHGENIDGQIDGSGPSIDLGLSERGRRQVERLSSRLATGSAIKPSVLLASTERRAAETAQLLAPAVGLEVSLSRELEEWRSDDGNISPEEFMAAWRALKERERAHHRFQPQSESQAEFFARVGGKLHAVTKDFEGGSVAIVTMAASFKQHFATSSASAMPHFGVRTPPQTTHPSLTGGPSLALIAGFLSIQTMLSTSTKPSNHSVKRTAPGVPGSAAYLKR